MHTQSSRLHCTPRDASRARRRTRAHARSWRRQAHQVVDPERVRCAADAAHASGENAAKTRWRSIIQLATDDGASSRHGWTRRREGTHARIWRVRVASVDADGVHATVLRDGAVAGVWFKFEDAVAWSFGYRAAGGIRSVGVARVASRRTYSCRGIVRACR